MFVLGIGTGRCGTQTLSTFLGLQKINTRHESLLMPWDFDQHQADNLIKHLQDGVTIDYPDVGEINFSLVNYCEYLLENLSSLRIIVIKRAKEDTVNSWMKNQSYVNLWTNGSHESFRQGDYLKYDELGNSFPKYDLEKEKALAQFWDDYYEYAEALTKKYSSSIKIFDMHSLFSDVLKQKELLDFIEVEESKQFRYALNKNFDNKSTLLTKNSMNILKALIKRDNLDLREFESKTSFQPYLLLKFLLLGIVFNKNIDKMPSFINEHKEICEEFLEDLKFLDSFEILKKDLASLIAFLNESSERYSYPNFIKLKVRELCVKSIV
ncbi:MAG: hypothetical protein HRT47_04785 [Candidatus Caenarcaniphilales bacterium]|nr:hypothetical protein [Candidatus Caenarcaniphilales bacterium]